MRPSATLLLIVAAVAQTPAQSASSRLVELSTPNATLGAEFTLAVSVRELSDGRLLIVDWSDKKLLVANWSNPAVTQIGRNGSGPESTSNRPHSSR